MTVNIRLSRASAADAERIHAMQVKAFAPLLEKYQDVGTNPASESVDRVRARLRQGWTYYYVIEADGEAAGAIRVVDAGDGSRKRISPLFVLPEYRNRGIAQAAIRLAEEKHGASGWTLETVLQEPGNLHLYEKMGYRLTGEAHAVNERMTLVLYGKE